MWEPDALTDDEKANFIWYEIIGLLIVAILVVIL